MQKTAEERFNMLARGWLAYPVTPIHSHLPKSGCRNVIPAKLPRDTYFLSIARKAETEEVVVAVARSVAVTARHTTVPRIVKAAATTAHTAGTR